MWLRRNAMLVAGVLAVGLLGGVAAWTDHTSARDAYAVHVGDQVQQQETLARLAGQYLDFTALATSAAASGDPWSLRRDDPRDVARLRALTRTSSFTTAGAEVVSATGDVLAAYPSAPALPPPSNRAMQPMYAALRAHQPALSSLVRWHGVPLVAVGVPLHGGGRTATLVAFADARTWPLEGYVRRGVPSGSGRPYVADSAGTIVAAPDRRDIGRRLHDAPLAGARSGRAGWATFDLEGAATFVSYAPAGVAGWTALTEQPRAAFDGPLPRRHEEEVLALVALLTVAIVVVVVFHHTRKNTLEAMADSRLYDPTTGLGQRSLFDIRLDAALAKFKRTGAPLALYYCDLDDFKKVNDRLGHGAGDDLLRIVAQRLRAAVRDEDAVVRMGGDEFAVIVEGVATPSEAAEVAARIRSFVCAPAKVAGGQDVAPRISIGGALLVDPLRADDLLYEADVAMYIAKADQLRHHINVLGFPVPTA